MFWPDCRPATAALASTRSVVVLPGCHIEREARPRIFSYVRSAFRPPNMGLPRGRAIQTARLERRGKRRSGVGAVHPTDEEKSIRLDPLRSRRPAGRGMRILTFTARRRARRRPFITSPQKDVAPCKPLATQTTVDWPRPRIEDCAAGSRAAPMVLHDLPNLAFEAPARAGGRYHTTRPYQQASAK